VAKIEKAMLGCDMEEVKKCANDGSNMNHGLLRVPIYLGELVTYVGIGGWYCPKCGNSIVTGSGFTLSKTNIRELGIDRLGS
jgi:YgiT-type zinc finger domain-containing protein